MKKQRLWVIVDLERRWISTEGHRSLRSAERAKSYLADPGWSIVPIALPKDPRRGGK